MLRLLPLQLFVLRHQVRVCVYIYKCSLLRAHSHTHSLTRWPLARFLLLILSPTHAPSPTPPYLTACPEHVGALGNVEARSLKLITRLSARDVVRLTGGWVGGWVDR